MRPRERGIGSADANLKPMVKDTKAIETAVKKVLEEGPQRKFVENVELAVNLQNLDLSKPQNRIDESVVLPNGLGRELRIAVFARGDVALKAEAAGGNVIRPDDIASYGKDKKLGRKLMREYDAFIAETAFMALIGKNLGPILGPKGRMPTPIGADSDVTALIAKMRRSVKLRSKDKPTFHVCVGRRDMKAEQLAENVDAVLKRLEGKLERGMQSVRSVYLKSSMGPPVRVV